MITLENTIKENEKAFDKKAYKITQVIGTYEYKH